MKILQIMAGADHGGAETAFVDMSLALHEAGETVAVATRPNATRNTRLREAGIPVHELPFGGAVDFLTPHLLKNIITGFKPQIVQTWMSRAAQKTPRWSETMNTPRYAVVSRLGGYYKAAHFKNAGWFTTITPAIRDHLIAAGINGSRVRHINNFAETEETAFPVPRAALGTPEDVPLLLALGRLHRAKAFDTLLQALVDVPGAFLWIAGEGADRENLENLAQTLNVADRTRFLGWRTDRAALFAACDVCVFPSRYEPFGTVFVQAWAAKRPLVTSNADGPRQFVRDGEDGLMVPVEDERALAAAISRVIADKALANRLAEAGYAHYRAAFTRERTVAEYLAFYREILEHEKIAENPARH